MDSPLDLSRYVRQQRFAPIGSEGQQKISRSSVLVCGCGALGSVIAERLVRSGVGKVRIVDRDWVELSNLQRQTLFNEQHAKLSIPKAVAAAEVLSQINSDVQIEPVVEDLTCDNIDTLASGCDLLLDGTDNFETRLLMNDYCLKQNLPWVHAGCLGASGQLMTIIPGKTACFRCLVPELPAAESMPTCDTAGVLGPAIGVLASWQAAEALKILSGNLQSICSNLVVLDLWETDCRQIKLTPTKDCPACQNGIFSFLDGKIRTESVVLCGKNAVQVSLPGVAGSISDLNRLAEKWQTLGSVSQNVFFVRVRLAEMQITLFRGGRTVVEGTTSPAQAKTLLAQILGS
ncbi:MAG: ThiF family adenylyltransferase [Pirellulales bacterium]